MNPTEAREIVECLPEGRTIFHYFKDRYALMLLAEVAGDGVSVRELRHSPFARLLEKPLVRDVLARASNGVVDRALFESYWPKQTESYLLTVGRWGVIDDWDRSFDQTIRPGENLVLQLNFSRKHDREAEALLGIDPDSAFNLSCHPVNDRGRRTMAWARIDIDLADGEALIEEVQSDWFYYALAYRDEIDSKRMWDDPAETMELYNERVPIRGYHEYITRVLDPYRKIWDEAVLSAAIWFLRHEIGIGRIFYYEAETGARLKGLAGQDGGEPPRSLYTKLPRKFCFRETTELPDFVARSADNYVRCQLRAHSLGWFLLEL